MTRPKRRSARRCRCCLAISIPSPIRSSRISTNWWRPGRSPLLNRVKDAPKRLLDEVTRFEPASLVGDQLSAHRTGSCSIAPTASARSQLFAAADAERSRARQRLIDSARPSRALERCCAPVQALFARLDAFSAGGCSRPLTDRVEQTIAADHRSLAGRQRFSTPSTASSDTVRDVLTFAQRIQSVADRVRQLFEAFVNADEQFDAMRDELLDHRCPAPDRRRW